MNHRRLAARPLIAPVAAGLLALAIGAPAPAGAQELTPPKPRPYVDEPAWVHDRPPKLTDRIWHAKPAPAGMKPQPLKRVRIVDLGDNIVRRHDHGKTGQGAFGSHLGTAVLSGVDVDGDGRKNNFISYRPFSLDLPISGRGPAFDVEGNNAKLYGGFVAFTVDGPGCLSETGMNVDEGKNWTFITGGNVGEFQVYGIWLWKKEDFRYGGDKHRVSFEKGDRIGLHCMRAWGGLDNARYVVKDGQKYYISEYNFGTPKAQRFKREGGKDVDPADYGLSPHTQATNGVVFGVEPARTRWAPYDPKAPYHITFDAKKATFAKHSFRDVQAIGFYIAKVEWEDRQMATKWYGFEAEATVRRPPRPSETLDMAEISGQWSVDSGQKAQIPQFYISRCEIPYVLFQRVCRWGVAPQYAFDKYYPYTTDTDGDMGSMDYGPDGKLLEHGSDEPVTDVTWLDAVLWCNMLSEYEGRDPVYYFTKDFQFIQRRARERNSNTARNAMYKPRVYVKWDADGYRLPTRAEWLAAAGTSIPRAASAWIGANAGGTTHDVGTKPANALGMYDMHGNVWEYVWDVGNHYDPGVKDLEAKHTVLGGDFNYPADPWTKLGNPYGDEPHKGHFSIGFRVVRRDKDLAPPPVTALPIPRSIPSWPIEQGYRGKGKDPKIVSEPVLEMVGIPEGSYRRSDSAKIFVSPFSMAKFEVSYAKWKEVRDWAVTAGYEFNYDGDMGSMDYQTWKHRHGPDEPVTGIARSDALVWCNALSQMEGRRPIYWKDDVIIFRSANLRRALWSRRSGLFDKPQLRVLGWLPGMKTDDKTYRNSPAGTFDMYLLGKGTHGGAHHLAKNLCGRPLSVDWSTDGYRLPTLAEWVIACQGGTKTQYYWGDEPDMDGQQAWSWHNSKGRTHPIGAKPPNPRGLHDILGNAFEMCWARQNTLKNQAVHETWNPKGINIGHSSHLMKGGSFMDSTFPKSSAQAFLTGNTEQAVWNWNAQTYVGFRHVRCKTRTHRRSGSEMPDDILILDVNLKLPVSPLQGQTDRANLQRTGVFFGKGVAKKPSVKWTFTPDPKGRLTSVPLVHRGTAYIGSDNGFFYALDAETGVEKWRYKIAKGPPYHEGADWPGSIWPCAPTIKDGILYTGSNGGYLYALDTRTGRPKWTTRVRGARWVIGSPVPAYGAIFVFIHTFSGNEGGLMAIHGETGQVLTIYKNEFVAAFRRSMSFADGTLMAGQGLVRLRSGSMDRVVLFSVRGANTQVMSKGKMYAVGRNIQKADYRSVKKDYDVPIEPGEPGTSSKYWSDNTLALWEDKLYFGNRAGYFYCCDAMTGKRLWRTKLSTRTRCAPTMSTIHGTETARVYIGCDDGALQALDATTGKLLWTFKTGDRIWLDAWVYEDSLYVASDDGNVYALEGK